MVWEAGATVGKSGPTAKEILTVYKTEFENPSIQKNDAEWDTILTLTVEPSEFTDVTDLEIEALANFSSGSDANGAFRLIVDDIMPTNSMSGAAIIGSLVAPNLATAFIKKILSLDPTVSHEIQFQWTSPSSTLISIDADSGGAVLTAKWVSVFVVP